MSEEPRGKSNASKWVLWSTAFVVVYVLGVGPANVLAHRLGFRGPSWEMLYFVYKPIRVLNAWFPTGECCTQYVSLWMKLTGTPTGPMGAALYYEDLDGNYPDSSMLPPTP